MNGFLGDLGGSVKRIWSLIGCSEREGSVRYNPYFLTWVWEVGGIGY